MKQIRNPAVREVYNSFPAAPRKQLKAIRQLLFEVAATEDVGANGSFPAIGTPCPFGSPIDCHLTLLNNAIKQSMLFSKHANCGNFTIGL